MWVSVIVLISVGITILQDNTSLITPTREITFGVVMRSVRVRSFDLIGKTNERTVNASASEPPKLMGRLPRWLKEFKEFKEIREFKEFREFIH